MNAAKFLVAFALGLTATLAQAAGFRFIEVPADADVLKHNFFMISPHLCL
jgi:hypothetical protein